MKKIKLSKKRNKKRKILRKSKVFQKKVGLKLKFLLLIIITILLFIFIFLDNKIKEAEKIGPNEIKYKGSIIQKNKLLEDYFSRISIKEQNKDHERKTLNDLFNMIEYSNETNLKNEYKNLVINFLSQSKGKPMDKLETIFRSQNCNFGNCIIELNNILFFCEIVKCHKIIFREKKSLIRNPIYIEKLNITITPNSRVNCQDNNTLCLTSRNWNPLKCALIKPQIRTQYLKEEIIKNIPQVTIEPKALYIHIRGGDVFTTHSFPYYTKPPLCFYEKVIDKNNFKNIYIISGDRKNIVLDALINKYNNIIFKHNDYKTDISLLIHAFNIVASVSSFLLSSIKFNYNLEHLWDYDIYRLSQKFRLLHHHLYKFNIKYKIHAMKPSDIYADQMYNWRASESQLKLMLEDKYPYDFVLTKPN